MPLPPDRTKLAAMEQTVLLVEDDRGLRESLATVLSFQGLTIIETDSAEEAEDLIDSRNPDLVVLDVNLPGRDGLDLLRRLRAGADDRQVLLLTARHEVADRVAGLDAGADDYLPKPFALDELLARVRVMLRRAETTPAEAEPSGSSTDSIGPVSLERAARRVTVSGREVELTKLEYDLLELLVDHADQVMTRAIIHDRVWGHDGGYGSNTLEVLVSGLRRKLEIDGADRIVHTVRGVGYVARPPRSEVR